MESDIGSVQVLLASFSAPQWQVPLIFSLWLLEVHQDVGDSWDTKVINVMNVVVIANFVIIMLSLDI